mmetsp:Transcript_24534/g.54614  ORF Transcript_24534/g.54614 Transcript_24534/m.54614 type:complete len:355 (-) Transcript_24534:365-1429(-)
MMAMMTCPPALEAFGNNDRGYEAWQTQVSGLAHAAGAGCVPGAPTNQSVAKVDPFAAVSLPNPWLWPTDATVPGVPQVAWGPSPPRMDTAIAVAGAGDVSALGGTRPCPDDAPMKVALFSMPGGDKAQVMGLAHMEEAYDPYREEAYDYESNYEPYADDVIKQNAFVSCRWHKSAETVGVLSDHGSVFTKAAGPRRSRRSDRGSLVELASICMVFDASLRCGGLHRYCYCIRAGELGAADGAGFVFDSKVRRNNIQRMRSVFLNQRGRICLRNNQHVTKLQARLPPLTVGVVLTLLIDLDALVATFYVSGAPGCPSGSASISLEGLLHLGLGLDQLRSGFFCAVVTGSVTVGLQ